MAHQSAKTPSSATSKTAVTGQVKENSTQNSNDPTTLRALPIESKKSAGAATATSAGASVGTSVGEVKKPAQTSSHEASSRDVPVTTESKKAPISGQKASKSSAATSKKKKATNTGPKAQASAKAVKSSKKKTTSGKTSDKKGGKTNNAAKNISSKNETGFEPFSNSFGKFATMSESLQSIQPLSQIMEPFMPNNSAQFDQFSNDAMQAIKEGNDAFTKSSNIMFKGFENYIKAFSNVVQETTDKSTAAFKEISQCKTLNEFTETQNVLAQKALEDLISNSTKLSELSVKICSESFEPINEHFTKTYKKASEKMAA